MINLEAEIAALRPSRSLLFCYTASLIHLENFLLDRMQQAGEGQVTLLVDRRAYEMTFAERSAVRAAGIDYHFAGVHLPGAAFHPKLYLCFNDVGATLFVASANLTLSGFRTNVEIVDRLHLSASGQGDTAAFRALAGYLEGLPVVDAALPDAVQEELRESAVQLRAWLAHGADSGPQLLHSLERPLLDQLRAAVPRDEVLEITVVSPFYDAAAEAIHQLAAAYPGATLNVMRRADSTHLSGRALSPLSDRVEVSDFCLRGKDADRRLHAKLLYLKGASRSWLVCGSANLSRSAWLRSAMAGGNVEAVTLREGGAAAFDALFDFVQPPERLDLSELVWVHDADEREPAPPFRLVEARQEGAQFTVRLVVAGDAWHNAAYSLHLDAENALPLSRGMGGEGRQERFARAEGDTPDEDRPLVVEIVGRLPDGRSARARGWLQRARSLGRNADERAFRRSVRALEARGRLTDAGDLIIITDLLARLASRLGELHAGFPGAGTSGSAAGKASDEERPERRIEGITIGEGGAALRGGPLSEPAMLLDRIIEGIQRTWREEADSEVETRGLAVSRGDAVDGAVEIGEEEARPSAPPLRASDIAALVARLENATLALFAGPPVPAAMPQAARLLVALAEFSFDMYRRLAAPEKAEQQGQALKLLDTLFDRAFSTEGIGAGAPDGWLVQAWLSPEVCPSLREAWESTTLSTTVAVLLGATACLAGRRQGQNRQLGRIAGLVLVLDAERVSTAEWAGAMRDLAAAAMLSRGDLDAEAVVGAIVEAPVHELPCLDALVNAAPYLLRQGVAVPGSPPTSRGVPDYGRNWDRLASRIGGEVLVPPAFRTENAACGRCFTTLPTEQANRVRHGSAHASCAACGRIVLPVDFHNEHVLRALAELARIGRRKSL